MIFIIYFLIFMTHYMLPRNCPFCALFFRNPLINDERRFHCICMKLHISSLLEVFRI
jgi:hypothetical protein